MSQASTETISGAVEVIVTTPGPAGPPGPPASMVRGQASKMDSGTITIATAGTYVSTGLAATFDASTAEGIELGTADTFGLKNASGETKLLQVFGSIDARTVAGNNITLGIKLALDGTPINETECRAFTGAATQEAKLVTSWIIEVADDEEISLFIANHTGDGDISFRRGRIIATEVLQ